ncbi:MAG TPA: hypothetical protein VFW23_13895 [Tepidisphaeraceae bacterium]|nr:hypothetical protein [Tepidisphaeraceae bacterium]
MTAAVIKQIESLGYVVKVFRINATVEMHAVSLRGVDEPQVARCNDGDSPDDEYRAACLLAAAVGIDLEGQWSATGKSCGAGSFCWRW